MGRSRSVWLVGNVALRVFLASVFAYAGVMKLLDLRAFAYEIRQYQVIPDQWSTAAANITPWFELVVSAFLLAGIWRAETRLLFALMIVAFIVLKLSAELRGLKIDCGCFGHATLLSRLLSGWWGVALNAGLLTLLALETLGCWRLRQGPAAPAAASGSRPR